MNAEQATHLREALGGSYEADHDVAAGACLQAADEINILMQAMAHGAALWLLSNGLLGIEHRLRAAAKLAGAVELAESEAAE